MPRSIAGASARSQFLFSSLKAVSAKPARTSRPASAALFLPMADYIQTIYYIMLYYVTLYYVILYHIIIRLYYTYSLLEHIQGEEVGAST